MNSLYTFNYNFLLFISMLIVIDIILESLCLIKSYLAHFQNNFYMDSLVLNIAIFAQLILYQFIFAKVLFNINDGYVIIYNFSYIRIGIFMLVTFLSIISIIQHHDLFPFANIIVSFMMLPQMEKLFDNSYGLIITLFTLYWMLRSANHLYLYHKDALNNLSSTSIKEALDTLDFGLLLCRADERYNGRVLLSNNKMQELMYILGGRHYYNGKLFYDGLISGDVAKFATKIERDDKIIYRLADGSIWNFKLEFVERSGQNYVLLVASNQTELSEATKNLYREQDALEKRNQELHNMLVNLDEICQSEETLAAKSRVHDLLAQNISIILRSVRDNQVLDDAKLKKFAKTMMDDLKNADIDYAYSLEKLVISFEKLGVKVNIDGQMPANIKIKQVFYQIIAEAMTNAVTHGYANEISIIIDSDDKLHSLLISDNGKTAKTEIVEGGGLRNMRHIVESLGGKFLYKTEPNFTIIVKVSERGYL